MITVSRIDWATQLMHSPRIIETLATKAGFDTSNHVHCNLYTLRGWWDLIQHGRDNEVAILDAIPSLPYLVKKLLRPPKLLSTFGDRHVHMLLERFGNVFNKLLYMVERQEVRDAIASDYVQCSGYKAMVYIQSIASGPRYIHAKDVFQPYTENPEVWLYQGILRWDKGVEDIIDAVVSKPRVQLLVIGTGPHLSTIQTYARQRGVAGRVFFLGHVANPKKFWDIADYVVVHRKPTRGNTYAEPGLRYRAEANNKPVLELSHNA